MTIDELRSRLTITVPEAGELLGIGRRQAYSAAKDGTLPVLHIGSRVVVKAQALLDLLEAN
ncbi:helix-turn-helix domain-containing protein [Diaminobutyricibacter tongyongensis]|uniref:Helix-turn-helix domain-containing protein n=1 Tax=Leifsonia tongyongensis TaxID=1268043 RepID=A0A6L9Y1N7_9MICO|nr:helix-turn-helix domain-containing protein [Diaminobutyricibacter tongyongensis]